MSDNNSSNKKMPHFNDSFAGLKTMREALSKQEQKPKHFIKKQKANSPKEHEEKTGTQSKNVSHAQKDKDDAALFLSYMNGVKRIDKQDAKQDFIREQKQKEDALALKQQQQKDAQQVMQTLNEMMINAQQWNIEQHGERVYARKPGVSQTLFNQLCQGELLIESSLDLHGLTELEAQEKTRTFIQTSQAYQCRVVLLITGKGMRGLSILKGSCVDWLISAPLNQWVIAFASATDADGGSGALYVMLKKKH